MELRITLGVGFAHHPSCTTKEIVVNVTDAGDGFDPEDVFVACNRIDELGIDQAQLKWAWQQDCRRLIDEIGAPSMSVHDVFVLHDGRGEGRVFIVAPTGFIEGTSVLEPAGLEPY
jgi:hypothetical protein